MAGAARTFPPYDRAPPATGAFHMSDNPTFSAQNRRFVTVNTSSTAPRPGQHLDDADLLAWKRQYANIGLREQNIMSNSAEDLSQLDRIPYQFEVFDQDYNDMDDDEIHLDNGNGYDYDAVIQDRLKRANEEFAHDRTPAELKHQQRVSFDAVVKAVDIVQDPAEYSNGDPIVKPPVSPVTEEPTPSSPSEAGVHAYTVPLNDTQPKEGLTLLEQLKAMQFHGVLPVNEGWSSTNSSTTTTEINGGASSYNEDAYSSLTRQSQNNDIDDIPDLTTESNGKISHTNNTTTSTSSQNPMLVEINGRFDLQDEDDYRAKYSKSERRLQFSDDQTTNSTNGKVSFIPAPPSEAKQREDPLKPQAPRRLPPPGTRPKSSDVERRINVSNSATTITTINSSSDNKNKTQTSDRQRPNSARVGKSIEQYHPKPSSGVDFDELIRKAAEKKRAEMREERRKREEMEAKRLLETAKAQQAFERWVRDKDAERKRFAEEKRLEKEEEDAREAEYEEQQNKLRKQKYDEWNNRKKQQQLLANEFEKLKADEDAPVSGGSSSSVNNGGRVGDHRAFHRWLRQKHEQSLEEKRQLRLEARRLRRRQRRSLKRFQLQQDLQLAKSFGYS